MNTIRDNRLPTDLLAPGEQVEVLCSFDGKWSSGFEIAEVLGGPPNWIYRIRRVSDGAVLPRNFDHRDITPSPSASDRRNERPARMVSA